MGRTHLHQKNGFVILPDNGRASGKGYATFVDRNGLIQVVPRRQKKLSLLAPLKLLALFVVLLTVFKALALSNVGVNTYQDQLASLESGTLVEQAGAWVLTVDPATSWLYQNGRGLLK